ncbi:MAG: thioredoxin family protein [bacterium]
MKKTSIVISIVTVLAAVTLVLMANVSEEPDGAKSAKTEKIKWYTFDKGFEQAQKENKVLVVDFYTDWCHWCKVMDKETYGNKAVIDFASENVIMAKIDAETNKKFKFLDGKYSGRELTRKFGITGFPATVFIDSKGEPITRVPGYIPADKFVVILKYISGNWYNKMKFDDFAKQEESKSKG